jgi:hypothetical protein
LQHIHLSPRSLLALGGACLRQHDSDLAVLESPKDTR